MAPKRKQAVVVIHGIGEQRPMATVRSFVEAVWSSDTNLQVLAKDGTPRYWTQPDPRFQSHEMARISTNRLPLRKGDDGKLEPGASTDFFEFYWQHLMGTSRWQHILGWLVPLLRRGPSRVPEPLHTAWWTLIIGSVVLGFCFSEPALAKLFGIGPFEWLLGHTFGGMARTALTLLTAGLGLIGANYVVPYLGDASRYLDGGPGNVKARQDIREEGLRLLRTLQDSGEYDRIVVVGHSLGSVIAYDLVRLLWAEAETPRTERRDAALKAVEEASAALHDEPSNRNRRAFHEAQRAFNTFLGDSWLVTDLISLGSPLAHADVLLADDRADLAALIDQRALSSCPPVLEQVQGQRRITYRTGPDGEKRWQTHHGAVFAAVKWTNIYFPYDGKLEGDMVGGPVHRLFGPGVEDVPVRSSRARSLSCHTHYWTPDANVGEHLVALRRALDLNR
jgi:hypothetical protein